MNYFYGILLTILGLLILARYVFKVKIPIFIVSTAIIIILVGVSLFFHRPEPGSDSEMVFSNKTIQVANPAEEYNLAFSGGTIDLSMVSPRHKGQKIRINSLLSCGTIKIKPGTPAVIRINSVLSVTQTPDNSSVYLGRYSYRTASFNENSNYLDIEINNIFTKLKVDEVIQTKTP
ncbi:MAG TPA: hypothetical protein DCZ10_04820 [Pelotomaculum sp.]|nr:hypothetical protein [Pelotomaculum sp.]